MQFLLEMARYRVRKRHYLLGLYHLLWGFVRFAQWQLLHYQNIFYLMDVPFDFSLCLTF